MPVAKNLDSLNETIRKEKSALDLPSNNEYVLTVDDEEYNIRENEGYSKFLLHVPLSERIKTVERIYEDPLDFKFSVDEIEKHTSLTVRQIQTPLGQLPDPLYLGKVEVSKEDVKDLINLFTLGNNHVELSDGNVIQREYNPTTQNYELYFMRNDGKPVKSRVIYFEDLNEELEKIAEWSRFNKNAAWEKLNQYVMINTDKVELVPISSFFQESVHGYELDEEGRTYVKTLKEKYMKKEKITEDNAIEFFLELEKTPRISKAYENHLRKKGKYIEDEFDLSIKERIDVGYLKEITGVLVEVDEDNRVIKLKGSIDDLTYALLEEEARGYIIEKKKSKIRKAVEFGIFGGVIGGLISGGNNFVNATSNENTLAVYSNDIDWNNCKDDVLSAAKEFDFNVIRVTNASELSSYDTILVLGGHEAYTDENMPINISKDYLDSEDELKLESSRDAKLIKVVKKPFGRVNQKLIIFAGNARDDTDKIPLGNYDEPKPDRWNNITEVLLGTNPLITEYELLSKVFFDYNGNGEYNPDVGEHPLADVILRVGEASCKSDEEGNCKMYAPYGENKMEINAPDNFR
ncbi:MAG: hypothetical protein ACE5K0_09510, partial [Candidatus Methanofastidiosia archaeon]